MTRERTIPRAPQTGLRLESGWRSRRWQRNARRPQMRPPVLFPHIPQSPLRKLGLRLAIAVALVTFVTALVMSDPDGYDDSRGGAVSVLDAVYYTTVSITTTGYGDIVPVTDRARLMTTLFVTPARVLFLVLLLGTTLEILAAGTREAIRLNRWEKKRSNHVIVCGFGTKGTAAVDVLLGHGLDREKVVVIDTDRDALERANGAGFVAIHGNASSSWVLSEAGITHAKAVIVAPHRDDTAVLMTLTARELNPSVQIIAAAREEENVHLIQQSGATAVISSSGSAGRLLGLGTYAPEVVDVLEDLLNVGEGLDIVKRTIGAGEAGRRASELPGMLVVRLSRDGEHLEMEEAAQETLREGDEVLAITTANDDSALEG